MVWNVLEGLDVLVDLLSELELDSAVDEVRIEGEDEVDIELCEELEKLVVVCELLDMLEDLLNELELDSGDVVKVEVPFPTLDELDREGDEVLDDVFATEDDDDCVSGSLLDVDDAELLVELETVDFEDDPAKATVTDELLEDEDELDDDGRIDELLDFDEVNVILATEDTSGAAERTGSVMERQEHALDILLDAYGVK